MHRKIRNLAYNSKNSKVWNWIRFRESDLVEINEFNKNAIQDIYELLDFRNLIIKSFLIGNYFYHSMKKYFNKSELLKKIGYFALFYETSIGNTFK